MTSPTDLVRSSDRCSTDLLGSTVTDVSVRQTLTLTCTQTDMCGPNVDLTGSYSTESGYIAGNITYNIMPESDRSCLITTGSV